jgi:hypothetical protein
VNAKELLAAVERAKNAIQNRIAGLKAQRVLIEVAGAGDVEASAAQGLRHKTRIIGRGRQGRALIAVIADDESESRFSWRGCALRACGSQRFAKKGENGQNCGQNPCKSLHVSPSVNDVSDLLTSPLWLNAG